jgi:hypothetical protein
MSDEIHHKNLRDGALRTSLLDLDRTSVNMHTGHTLWDFVAATEQAMASTVRIRVDRARSATLHLNSDVRLDEADLEELLRVIGAEHLPEYETRSGWFNLRRPIAELAGSPIEPARALQIKGVVFDSAKPPLVYRGKGAQPHLAFASKDAFTCVYDLPCEISGILPLAEAVNEYNIGVEAWNRLVLTDVHVPVPVGWGRFDEESFTGGERGFVILGTPTLLRDRVGPYFESLRTLLDSGDFSPMRNLLGLRAHAISTMHKAGFVVPFRHCGNMSMRADGTACMHDLGSPRALVREDMVSDEQFITEAFIHLKYALTPSDIVVPRPEPECAERLAPLRYLDFYTRATLTGYYGIASSCSSATWEEIEEVFLASFDTPLPQIRLPFAQAHCETAMGWLNSLRR